MPVMKKMEPNLTIHWIRKGGPPWFWSVLVLNSPL